MESLMQTINKIWSIGSQTPEKLKALGNKHLNDIVARENMQ